MNRRWTDDELEFLRREYPRCKSVLDLAKGLDRSEMVVYQKANDLGLSRPKHPLSRVETNLQRSRTAGIAAIRLHWNRHKAPDHIDHSHDAEAIDRFIQEHGVKRCPVKAIAATTAFDEPAFYRQAHYARHIRGAL